MSNLFVSNLFGILVECLIFLPLVECLIFLFCELMSGNSDAIGEARA